MFPRRLTGLWQRRGLWQHSDFLKFWSAQSLSLLGIQFGRIALPLVAILSLDASAAQVGLLTAVGGLPWLVLGLFAGVVIDRLPRRPVLIVAHVGRALLWGSIPVAAAFGGLDLIQLYAVAVLSGIFNVCFEIAYRSYLPSLVGHDRLAEGYGKLAVTDGAARAAGPSVAGALVQVLTAPLALAVQALSYLGSAALLWRVHHAEPAPGPGRARGHPWASIREGLEFAWRQAIVRALILSEATYTCSFAVLSAVLMVFFARRLHLDPALIGIIFTVGSIGGILGGLVARGLGNRLRRGRAVLVGSLLRGCGIAIVPLAALAGPLGLPLLIVSRLVNAFGWTVWDVHQETTQQLLTPNRMRGRVNASALLAIHGFDTLGGFAGTGLAALLGVLPTLTIGAVGAALGTAWLLTRRVLDHDGTTR